MWKAEKALQVLGENQNRCSKSFIIFDFLYLLIPLEGWYQQLLNYVYHLGLQKLFNSLKYNFASHFVLKMLVPTDVKHNVLCLR